MSNVKKSVKKKEEKKRSIRQPLDAVFVFKMPLKVSLLLQKNLSNKKNKICHTFNSCHRSAACQTAIFLFITLTTERAVFAAAQKPI